MKPRKLSAKQRHVRKLDRMGLGLIGFSLLFFMFWYYLMAMSL